MRILASIHLFYPRHCCGSESMLLHIFKYLITKGHQCRVILHQYSGPPYVYEGVEVFPATGSVDAYLWADRIITHLDFTQYSILMAHTAQRPLIHMIHNDIEYSSINAASIGQFIVYNSNWIQNKIGYKHPSTILHPPCELQYYQVQETGQFNDYITLISLNERKGGHRLYEIAKSLPHKKFLGVIGSYDNPGKLKLEQSVIVQMLSELGNVTVIPNSPDILSVYRRTRLLLMPSDYESWGRTATEAMCNGIPVICTPTEGLRENCADAGTYVGHPIDGAPGEAQVDIGTVQDWVKAIRKFDDPKYYREKSLLCRQRAAELDPLKELEALEQFILSARF